MQPTNNHSTLTNMLLSRVQRPLESNAPTPVHVPLANTAETRITLYGSRCGLGMLLGVLALLGKSSYRVVFDALRQLDAVGCYKVLCHLQCLRKPRYGVKTAPWDTFYSNTTLSSVSTASTSSSASRGSATNLSSARFLSITDAIVVSPNLAQPDLTSMPACTQVIHDHNFMREITPVQKKTGGLTGNQHAHGDVSESWGHFVFLEDE